MAEQGFTPGLTESRAQGPFSQPPAHPPDASNLMVILDMDLCTTLCVTHNRVLPRTSDFFDYGNEGGTTEENNCVEHLCENICVRISVLSVFSERLLGSPHRPCSSLFQPQRVMSFLF